MNLSTIYRNLEELVHLRVVDRPCYGQGAATYHLTTRGHSHLVCDGCGEVTEIPDVLFSALSSAVLGHYGFTIAPRQSAFIGQCRQCTAIQPDPALPAG